MHSPIRPLYFVAVAVALATLSACAGGGEMSSALPVAKAPAMQQVSGNDLFDPFKKPRAANGVYVAMEQQTNLYAVPNSGNAPPACTIPEQTTKGIAVDSAGTLWVPSASGIIASYRKGTCKPGLRMLTETTALPNDIAFSTGGTAYVTVNSPSPLVLVFKKGHASPTSTLNDPSVTVFRGVAVDGAGNVFVSCVKENERSCVMQFKGGQMPGKLLDVQVGISDGLEIDASHKLIVVDPGSRLAEVFTPPYKGAPAFAFSLRGSSEFGKLDAANTNFYASNFSSGTLDVFKYPSGTYEYSISNGLQVDGVWGVAVYPASKH